MKCFALILKEYNTTGKLRHLAMSYILAQPGQASATKLDLKMAPAKSSVHRCSRDRL